MTMQNEGVLSTETDVMNGCEQTETDDKSASVFLRACQYCDEQQLEKMIQNGLTEQEVKYADRSGKTGISYACSNGFLPVLKLLENMQELFDINSADKEGTTPLMLAAQAGHWDVVNYLLTNYKNLEIDKRDNAGFTALIKSAIQGRNRCAKLLVLSGASTDMRDFRRGYCASEWAEFCGRHVCCSLILRLTEQLKVVRRCADEMHKQPLGKASSDPDLSRITTLDAFDHDKSVKSHHKKCKKSASLSASKNKKGTKKTKSDSNFSTNGKFRINEERTISELVFSSTCLSFSGLPSNSTPPNSPLLSRIAQWASRTSRKPQLVVPKVMVTKPSEETGLSRRLNAILSPPSSRRRRPPRDPLAIGRTSESSSSDEDD